jgi:hypothetical protein
MKYGTLEPIAEPKRTSSSKLLVVVGVLASVALLGFGVRQTQVSEAVDTNRGRTGTNPTSPYVQKAFQNACDRVLPQRARKVVKGPKGKKIVIPGIPAPLRFSIAGLNKINQHKYKLVPQVSYGATDDWINDWKMFKDMMPQRSPAVGFGVYNFPVWEDPSTKEKYKLYTTFVSYQKATKPYPDLQARYLGGTFLGSALLAASGSVQSQVPRPHWAKKAEKGQKRQCAITSIAIDSNTGYEEACLKVVLSAPGNKYTKAQAKDMCDAVEIDSCPFGNKAGSPCCKNKLKCKKPCGLVTAWMGHTPYGKKCCAQIKSWCKSNSKGCSTRFHQAIYARNCNPGYGTAKYEKLIVLSGIKGEKDQCLSQCRNPCTSFRNREQTYKACAGCAKDFVLHRYGKKKFVAKCFPGAHGFKNFRCCGDSPACGVAKSNGKCQVATPKKLAERKGKCEWITHNQCISKLQKIQAKKIAAAKAAAAKKAAAKEPAAKKKL